MTLLRTYCKVNNGEVTQGPKSLPTNLQSLLDFELREIGWLPAKEQRPDSFNAATEEWLPHEFIVHSQYVDVIWKKKDKK